MSNSQPALISPLSSVAKFGLTTGILLMLSFWYTTVYTADTKQNLPAAVGLMQLIVFALGILLAILDHRKKFMNRPMQMKEVIGCGLLTSLVIGIILAVFMFLFFTFDDTTRNAIIQIDIANTPVAERAIKLANMKNTPELMKNLGMGMTLFSMSLIGGLIFSGMLAPFLQKKKA
jgi:hypothetical protein